MRPSDDLLRRLFNAPPEKVLIVLLALLIGAAIYDMRYRKIPNWLTVTGVLLGFAINFGIGPPEGGVVFALAGLSCRIRHLHGAVCAPCDGRGRCETDGGGRGVGRIRAMVRHLPRDGDRRRRHGARSLWRCAGA